MGREVPNLGERLGALLVAEFSSNGTNYWNETISRDHLAEQESIWAMLVLQTSTKFANSNWWF